MNVVQPIPRAENASKSKEFDLEIREATEVDLDAIRELHVAVGYDERNHTYDHWRFFGGPYGICPSILAMDEDRAAALYTVWPVKLKLGNDILLGGQSMDTMTHPDYRGRGLFVKLAGACYELCAARGYAALYGFPNSNSYPGFIRRLNWDHTGDIVHWVRPIRPSNYKSLPKAFGPFADFAASVLPRGSIKNTEISIGKPDPAAMQTLMDRWNDENDTCRIHRESCWLEWRYAPEAQMDYEWVCAYRNGSLVGMGVWGMHTAAWGRFADGRARLGELMGEAPTDVEAVLATIIERAKARSASMLESYCNIEPVVTAFRHAGFFKYKKAPFIVRALTARPLGGNIHNHDAWRIAGGDWDAT
ncbi:MAG: GNAT family N-acetyltransferase [Proteobacteria bacterium]|nr:GNAT family N-acetyltransferase [Pseudomonadota bacterium]